MIEITIPTAEQGIGGQSGVGGTISALAVQLYDHNGNTANIPNGALEVYVTGGTVQSQVSFSGSISTDIGNVKIEDKDENYAVMPPVGTPKTNATTALVVTAIDETGAALRQSTQQVIMNNQGTQALDATSRSIRDSIAAVYNNQGTLAHQSTLAQVSSTLTAILNAQGTQNTDGDTTEIQALSLIANNQGTAATSVAQSTQTGLLSSILNAQGTQSTSGLATTTGVAAIVNNQGTQATEVTLERVSNTLTAIMNAQGTATAAGVAVIYNNQGTQSTEATLAKVSTTLTAILNAQGTQSTGSDSTENNQLASIYNSQGTIQRIALYGTNGMPIDVAMDSEGEYHLAVTAIQSVYPSAGNSYTSNLTTGAVFYGTKETTLGIAAIQVMLKSDTNCLVTVQQTGDGSNWDISDNYTYYYSKGGQSWTTQAVGTDFRVSVQNTGASTSGYLRLFTAMCPVLEAVPRDLSDAGNFRTSVEELLGTFGSKVKSSPMGQLRVVESTRLVGADFGDKAVLDTSYWGSVAVGTGTIVPGGNQVALKTGTTSASSGTLLSVRSGRYVSGNSNYYRGVVRAPAVTGSNIRRWGAYTEATGYFFETDGTTLSLVCRKNSVDTNRVSSGAFNGDAGATYSPGTNVVTYEIYWTNKSTWFFADDVLIHKFSGTTSPLALTNTLPCRAVNFNAAGNTNSNDLEIRSASISRMGHLATDSIYKYIAASGTTVCKYGAGRLHRLVFNNPDAAAQNVLVTDSQGNASPIMANFGIPNLNNVGVPASIEFQCPFFNGLTVITDTVQPITVIYE